MLFLNSNGFFYAKKAREAGAHLMARQDSKSLVIGDEHLVLDANDLGISMSISRPEFGQSHSNPLFFRRWATPTNRLVFMRDGGRVSHL
jgi:hypothetical protein